MIFKHSKALHYSDCLAITAAIGLLDLWGLGFIFFKEKLLVHDRIWQITPVYVLELWLGCPQVNKCLLTPMENGIFQDTGYHQNHI